MKALLCRAHGLPETLEVGELPLPRPGEGEVRVAVKAAGVNFPDALIIQDKYQFKPALPFSPGGELAGVVTAVGPGVTRAAVGDRVAAMVAWGAFAEEVLVPQDRLVALPEGMPFEVGGAFLMTYGTCWHALKDRAQLQPGETLLVLGAAGGIGLAAIELGKALGARVIAAASSPEKLQACKAQGADELIDYEREDLRERLKAITGGRGVDVVCDPVGGRFSEPALRSIAWRGRFLVVGFAGGEIPRLPLNLMLLKGCSVVGVFWGDFVRREPAAAAADTRALFDLFSSGALRPRITAQCDLAGAPAVLDQLLNRQLVGKAVVRP